MDVWDICSGLDHSSPHRVSMEGPIFKPFGNPVALFVEVFCPKPNYFIQSWVGTISEIQQSNMDILGAQQKEKRAFFLQTPVGTDWEDPTFGPTFGAQIWTHIRIHV